MNKQTLYLLNGSFDSISFLKMFVMMNLLSFHPIMNNFNDSSNKAIFFTVPLIGSELLYHKHEFYF